jgi:hypothetical protein
MVVSYHHGVLDELASLRENVEETVVVLYLVMTVRGTVVVVVVVVDGVVEL